MKRMIVSIIMVIGLSVSIFALSVNECKTDIYFGNGVWNSSEDAKKNAVKLNDLVIQREIIKGDPALQAKYGTVKLQYNWGQGRDIDLVETFLKLFPDS